jgi:hypothetical protein
MHSEIGKHNVVSHIKKDAHRRRDQRILFEEVLYGHTINCVVLLIDSLTRSVKTTAPTRIINTGERCTL